MDRYPYLSALRGWAIFGVILVHVSQAVPDLPHQLRLLADQGARGVQLFFVVSALTLMLSWHRRHDGVLPFYIRRLFRIAPVFWLAIAGFLLLDGFGPRYWAPHGIDWRHVLATLTFQHGWHPATITSVVPGGWTIAVEMTFYAMFPIIASVSRRWWHAALLFVLSLLVFRFASMDTYVWPGFEPAYLAANFRFLWIFSQLPVFLIGVALFFVVPYSAKWSRPAGALLAITAIVVTFFLPFVQELLPLSVVQSRWVHIAYGLTFGFLIVGLSTSWNGPLVNPILCWIGDRSYSAYLWHFALIGLASRAGLFNLSHLHPLVQFVVYFGGIASLTMLCSAITYALFEEPAIRLGRAILTTAKAPEQGIAVQSQISP